MPSGRRPSGNPSDNPFDDPEFRAFMAQNGIVHKQGMAADLMSELAPLLAAEGIDLDAPTTRCVDSSTSACSC